MAEVWGEMKEEAKGTPTVSYSLFLEATRQHLYLISHPQELRHGATVNAGRGEMWFLSWITCPSKRYIKWKK